MRKSHRIWLACAPAIGAMMKRFGPDARDGGPPSGMFDECAEIEVGRVEGGASTQRRWMPEIPLTSELRTAGLDQDAAMDWPVVWSHRRDTWVLARSHAHLDAENRACRESIYGPHAATDPVWKRFRKKPLRVLEGNWTSVVSRWNDGVSYYHWFMDGLTRLSHLEHFPEDTRILVPAGIPEFAWRSLQHLGLDKRVVETADEDLWIENYWFAGPTMLSGCPDPAGVDWLRGRFPTGTSAMISDLPTGLAVKNGGHLDRSLQKPGLKIWIDRRAGRRSCVNADEVNAWFRNAGWEVVDPGKLSLDAQIQLFSEASTVAAIHGAALTNALWMPKGSKVLEIMPSQRRNGCYEAIALCAGIHHRTWLAASDRHGNVTIPVDEISRHLDALDEYPDPAVS